VVAHELETRGFLRLLDVFAVPVCNPAGVRYPIQRSFEPRGGAWYLRSYGLNFDLVDRKWLKCKARGFFSLGCGLVGEREVPHLLLLQAFGLPSQLSQLHAEIHQLLEPAAHALCAAVGTRQNDDCFRLTAWLHVPENVGPRDAER